MVEKLSVFFKKLLHSFVPSAFAHIAKCSVMCICVLDIDVYWRGLLFNA